MFFDFVIPREGLPTPWRRFFLGWFAPNWYRRCQTNNFLWLMCFKLLPININPKQKNVHFLQINSSRHRPWLHELRLSPPPKSLDWFYLSNLDSPDLGWDSPTAPSTSESYRKGAAIHAKVVGKFESCNVWKAFFKQVPYGTQLHK